MVDGKKHIDEFFRESLEGYEPVVPPGVWDQIRRRSSRRVLILPLWRRVAAAAAILIVCLTTWILLDRPSGSPVAEDQGRETSVHPAPASRDLTPAPDSRLTDRIAARAEGTSLVTRAGRETPQEEQAAMTRTEGPVTEVRSSMAHLERQFGAIGSEEAVTIHLPVVASAEAPPPAPEEWTRTREPLRWGIAGQFSPMYTHRFLTSKAGNEYMVSYYDKIEGGLVTYSGGLTVNLTPSRRLMVSTGLYYSTMGQSIRGVTELTVSSLGWETNSLLAMIEQKFYLVNNSTGVIEAGNKYVNIVGMPGQISDITSGRDQQMSWSDLSASDARVIQNFEFLELPVVLRYRMIDRKIGVHLVGGFSTNFLVGNQATFFLGNDEYSTVSTTDLNTINYSSIVGMGIDYELMPRLLLTMEPTFKYYLNSFSSKNLIGSHPYALGMFSGLRFIF